MKFLLGAAALLLGLAPRFAAAAPFSNDEISLDLPADFQGPVLPGPDFPATPDASAFLFKKLHADGTATVIQVTTWTHHANFPPLPTSLLERLGDKYLDDMLKGEARQQVPFTEEPIRHVLLDGVPFSMRHWRGRMHERWSVGAMYCGLIDAKLLCLQARDLEDVPDSGLPQAVAAIEQVKLRHPPARAADDPATP